ncbi:MAG: ABC transporter substrate-binding protein [Anaerolineae bacterium]|jgi:peptide/nickel transport system substrate-binding protein/oligopeptide transport system substrate-binding protein|nr:ABC transporter substrate-binding protein [Anaerolineae bacterium]
MSRVSRGLCLLLAGLLALTGSVFAQDSSSVLRYPIDSDPEQLNPFVSDTIAAGRVLRNIYEGLARYNAETGVVEPAIAESWEITTNAEGQQVYTFKLRQGVLFHEVAGVTLTDREVTADDILWNYLVALNGDDNVSLLASGLEFILGAAEYTAMYDTALEADPEADLPLIMEDVSVPGLAVIDDYTFQITLAQPDRLFLINGLVSIVSPEAYAALGDDINNVAVGTGPYRFVEWLRDDRLTLEANPDYYLAGLPKNDGVVFINYPEASTALLDYRENNLDFLFAFPSGQRTAVIEEFASDFSEKPGLHLRYWGINMNNGFLAENKAVRQALSYTLDRQTAWDILAEGARFPASLGMLVPAMPASTPATIYTYDLAQARAILDAAGFTATGAPIAEGGDGRREGIPTLRVYLLEAISTEPQIVLWQEDLAQLGIEVEFVIEDGATYWDSIVTDESMIFINGWAAGIIDPSDVFDFLILDGNGSMRYDNPVVNELLRQARVEADEAARTALYQQAHDIIMDDAPLIASAYSKVSWLQKPWVQDFVPGGGGTYTAPLWNVVIEGRP